MTATAPLIRSIVSRELAIAPELVTDRLGPGDVPAWDSIGHLQVVRAVERELGIVLTVAEVMEVGSVADLVGIAARRAGSR